jgi:hypothetical protein
MPNHLMLLAWPTGVGDQIATSFRYSSYVSPFKSILNPTFLTVDSEHINHPPHTREQQISHKSTPV